MIEKIKHTRNIQHRLEIFHTYDMRMSLIRRLQYKLMLMRYSLMLDAINNRDDRLWELSERIEKWKKRKY